MAGLAGAMPDNAAVADDDSIGAPSNPRRAEAGWVRELLEAHTALTCYLAVAKTMSELMPDSEDGSLRQVIDDSIAEVQRANEAVRNLQRCFGN